MTLQVKLQDLRKMIKEKCEEIISDKKLAYELCWRICDIEDDVRFTVVEESKEDGWSGMTDLVSKSSVLDIYAELYDVFDDNKAIQEELHKVYDKLRGLKSSNQ